MKRQRLLSKLQKDINLICSLLPVWVSVQGCPSSYQQWMEDVLEGIKGTHVYLDDIIYASVTWEEHLKVLEAAFQRLHKHKLKYTSMH